MLVFDPGADPIIIAKEPEKLMLLGGEPWEKDIFGLNQKKEPAFHKFSYFYTEEISEALHIPKDLIGAFIILKIDLQCSNFSKIK